MLFQIDRVTLTVPLCLLLQWFINFKTGICKTFTVLKNVIWVKYFCLKERQEQVYVKWKNTFAIRFLVFNRIFKIIFRYCTQVPIYLLIRFHLYIFLLSCRKHFTGHKRICNICSISISRDSLHLSIKKINQKKKLTSSKLQMWEHLLQLQQRNKRPCFWQWVCKAEQLFPALLKRLSWQRKNLTTPNLASKHQNLYQVFSFAKKNINNPKFSIETKAKSLPSLPIKLQQRLLKCEKLKQPI